MGILSNKRTNNKESLSGWYSDEELTQLRNAPLSYNCIYYYEGVRRAIRVTSQRESLKVKKTSKTKNKETKKIHWLNCLKPKEEMYNI